MAPIFAAEKTHANALKGVLWSLLGTGIFAVILSSAKLTGGEIPALQIIAIRYATGFLTVLAVAFAAGQGLGAFRSNDRPRHLLRGICGAVGGMCVLHAPTESPLADATALTLLEGVMILILAALFLKERVGRIHIMSSIICIVGGYIVVTGSTADGGVGAVVGGTPWLGITAALLGGLFIAFETILIKILSGRERMLTMLLYVNAFGALAAGIPALITWKAFDWNVFWPLLLLGPMAIVAQSCNIRAYRLADASFLAPFGYSWLVFSGLLGFIVFAEIPTTAVWIGGAMIVAGGVLMTRMPIVPMVSQAASDRKPPSNRP